eukprot:6490941-Amphidinium_carterae.1
MVKYVGFIKGSTGIEEQHSEGGVRFNSAIYLSTHMACRNVDVQGPHFERLAPECVALNLSSFDVFACVGYLKSCTKRTSSKTKQLSRHTAANLPF